MLKAFEKWHGCKNDFVVVWLDPTEDLTRDALIRQAKTLCSRDGGGIGADGLLLLHKSRYDDLQPERLTIVNSDGSVAKTCGNGIRCAAASVLKRMREEAKFHEIPEAVMFQLEDCTVDCRFLTKANLKSDRSAIPLIAVEMGEPVLNENLDFFAAAKSEIQRVAKELNLPSLTSEFAVAQISNQHLVFFFSDEKTFDPKLIYRIGPALQKSAHWDGINVHLAAPRTVDDKTRTQIANQLGSPVDEVYQALSWERGAGPTQACGSGATVIGAALFDSGLVERDWVCIEMPGGRLFVRQDDADGPATLAGPAELVFIGQLVI